MARTPSGILPKAVKLITSVEGLISLIWGINSTPLISGSLTSLRTTEISFFLSCSKPDLALAACNTLYPSSSSILEIRERRRSSSSMIKIFLMAYFSTNNDQLITFPKLTLRYWRIAGVNSLADGLAIDNADSNLMLYDQCLSLKNLQ